MDPWPLALRDPQMPGTALTAHVQRRLPTTEQLIKALPPGMWTHSNYHSPQCFIIVLDPSEGSHDHTS